jgi:hypothetical protein
MHSIKYRALWSRVIERAHELERNGCDQDEIVPEPECTTNKNGTKTMGNKNLNDIDLS